MFEHPDGAGGEGRVQARLESPRRHYAIPAHLPGELAPLDGGSSRRSTVMRLGPSGQPAYIRVIRRRSRLTRHRPGASGAHRVQTRTPPRPLRHTAGRPAGVVESCRGMPHRFLLDSWSFHISVVNWKSVYKSSARWTPLRRLAPAPFPAGGYPMPACPYPGSAATPRRPPCRRGVARRVPMRSMGVARRSGASTGPWNMAANL